MSPPVFTAALDFELKRLWNADIPTSEIADRLGIGRTTIIGRAHKLGLKMRSAISIKVLQGVYLNRTAGRYFGIQPGFEGGRITQKGCRFPLWPDGAFPTHEYCNVPRRRDRHGDIDSPYCELHSAVCFTAYVLKPRKAG